MLTINISCKKKDKVQYYNHDIRVSLLWLANTLRLLWGWINSTTSSRIHILLGWINSTINNLINWAVRKSILLTTVGYWLRGYLARLLLRGFSKGARAVLQELQFVAPSKRLRLLCFLLKNDSSKKTFGKTFGRAPLEEPERSPAKQALGDRHDIYLDLNWKHLKNIINLEDTRNTF